MLISSERKSNRLLFAVGERNTERFIVKQKKSVVG